MTDRNCQTHGAAGALLLAAVFAGCAVKGVGPNALADDPRNAAIQVVAMHACDLVRVEDPEEIEPLKATMAALQVLLRDEQADWGVISATFGEIPARSKRYLGLSAAMAKQYADDVPGYYAGLRRLTTGCLVGLISAPATTKNGDRSPNDPPAKDVSRSKPAAGYR